MVATTCSLVLGSLWLLMLAGWLEEVFHHWLLLLLTIAHLPLVLISFIEWLLVVMPRYTWRWSLRLHTIHTFEVFISV